MDQRSRHSLPTRLLPLLLAVLTATLVSPVPPGAAAELRPEPAGVWPLSPRPDVVGDFSPPVTTWGSGHRGVDLAGQAGQVVRAARAGTVTFAGRLAGRGVVVVSHGATRTTYEPVTAQVARGDRVRAGANLGVLELFGSHCFPRACLHWGLLEGDRYLNPLDLVGAGPVRLLPWLSGLPLDGTAHALAPAVPQHPGWQPLGAGPLFRR